MKLKNYLILIALVVPTVFLYSHNSEAGIFKVFKKETKVLKKGTKVLKEDHQVMKAEHADCSKCQTKRQNCMDVKHISADKCNKKFNECKKNNKVAIFCPYE